MRPRLQFIDGLWRCVDKDRYERAAYLLKHGACPPRLTPIGRNTTPQGAYDDWVFFQEYEERELHRSAQRSALIGRAEGCARARLKLIGEKWLCVGGRNYFRFPIEGEGVTALEAYERWKDKSSTDYLGKLVVEPLAEPASSPGWRMVAGIVAIVVGIALLIWAGLGALAISNDSHPEASACLERSAAQ